eukprot:Nk52_evm37s1569 gene=Nk52_evmTU37s1569
MRTFTPAVLLTLFSAALFLISISVHAQHAFSESGPGHAEGDPDTDSHNSNRTSVDEGYSCGCDDDLAETTFIGRSEQEYLADGELPPKASAPGAFSFPQDYQNIRITPVLVGPFDMSLEKQQYLEKTVMPLAVAQLQIALGVRPIKTRLWLDRGDFECAGRWTSGVNSGKCAVKRQTSNVMCGSYIKVPDDHLGELEICPSSSDPNSCYMDGQRGQGMPNTDFILYVTAQNIGSCSSTGSVLAFAAACSQDQMDRPVAGYTNFCPNKFSTDSSRLQATVKTALHEITHALGFSKWLMRYYRDENGNPRTPRNGAGYPPSSPSTNTVASFFERGATVEKVVLPTVIEKAREHFGCNSLNGAELENGGSHWESRTFYGEFMTAAISSFPVLSKLTLALLHDSGWYVANFTSAEKFYYGESKGCSFPVEKCIQGSSSNPYASDQAFCTQTTEGCSYDHLAKAQCTVTTGWSNIPSIYRYFGSSGKGGLSSYADFCPLYMPYSNGDCRDESNYVSTLERYRGERWGSQSRCFVSTLSSGSPDGRQRGRCYEHRCTMGELEIRISGSSWKKCPTGSQVSFSGFSGNVKCPENKALCSDLPVGCDGIPGSGKVVDECGECGGNGLSCAGCDSVPNSGKKYDVCGVCGGDGTSCLGCDGIPNSGKVVDACGECGGDGDSCIGCDGIPNSGNIVDACGVCGGDGTLCIGCDGVANSNKKVDECGVCGGNGRSCKTCRVKYGVTRENVCSKIKWACNAISCNLEPDCSFYNILSSANAILDQYYKKIGSCSRSVGEIVRSSNTLAKYEPFITCKARADASLQTICGALQWTCNYIGCSGSQKSCDDGQIVHNANDAFQKYYNSKNACSASSGALIVDAGSYQQANVRGDAVCVVQANVDLEKVCSTLRWTCDRIQCSSNSCTESILIANANSAIGKYYKEKGACSSSIGMLIRAEPAKDEPKVCVVNPSIKDKSQICNVLKWMCNQITCVSSSCDEKVILNNANRALMEYHIKKSACSRSIGVLVNKSQAPSIRTCIVRTGVSTDTICKALTYACTRVSCQSSSCSSSVLFENASKAFALYYGELAVCSRSAGEVVEISELTKSDKSPRIRCQVKPGAPTDLVCASFTWVCSEPQISCGPINCSNPALLLNQANVVFDQYFQLFRSKGDEVCTFNGTAELVFQ